jgi:hypothetical protein
VNEKREERTEEEAREAEVDPKSGDRLRIQNCHDRPERQRQGGLRAALEERAWMIYDIDIDIVAS